jgi:hypothetical protein
MVDRQAAYTRWYARPKAAALAIGLLGLMLAGCGGGRRLDSPRLPLVSGAHVIYHEKSCDTGSHVFCGVEVVVTDDRFSSAGALVASEARRLQGLRWTLQQGEINQERSALSPGGKLRIIYASAPQELLAIDFGWTMRSPALIRSLDHSMINRIPAMMLVLEAGPS